MLDVIPAETRVTPYGRMHPNDILKLVYFYKYIKVVI